ncbi:MAG: hypothetical protein LBG84_02130 [Treponema sp.]|jgi:hypothetical protein|nr:hypothetical protein [Treponema sp.]
MRFFALGVLAVFCLLVSCEGEPAVVQDQPPAKGPVSPPSRSVSRSSQPAFNPATVSPEERTVALRDCQELIKTLNGIIERKDYNTWVSYLDPVYVNLINNPVYLKNISLNSDRLKYNNIILKSPQDFFYNVVVPSRRSNHVDDIDFVASNIVKAFQINAKAGTKIRLYYLKKYPNGWKITAGDEELEVLNQILAPPG